jgi:hypothetical protein
MEDADQDSPLYRIVDRSTVALAGHSFGGVVGLFASAVDACVDAPPFLLPVFCDGQYERPAALRATGFYGTSLFSPFPPFNLTNLNTQGVAVALIHGTNDGVETLDEAEQTYQTLEKPSALITIGGTNHYGICDENNSPGAIPDLTPPTLDQEKATARVAKWTGLWLRAQLKDDLDSQFRLYTLGGSLDEVVTVETD